MTARVFKSTNVEEANHLRAGRLAWWPDQSKFLSFHEKEEKSSYCTDCKRQLLSLKHFQDARLPKPCWSRNGFFHTVCSQCSSYTLLLLLHCSVGKVYIALKLGCLILPSHKTAAWLKAASTILPQACACCNKSKHCFSGVNSFIFKI